MKTKVLITGGSGLIGKHLVTLLRSQKYDVNVLSRNPKEKGEYYWDVAKGEIDDEALRAVQHVIHLAGANIGNHRWTAGYRELLLSSRVDGIGLLISKLEKMAGLKTFISASAIGYYGQYTDEKIYDEEDEPGNDFPAQLCVSWETALKPLQKQGVRCVSLRTGVVLSKDGGVLKKMLAPMRYGFGAVLGSGRQYIPWIHIDDLCRMYQKALEDEGLSGVYNAVAPEHHDNESFTRTLAEVSGYRLFPLPVPAFLLNIFLGKRSSLLLKGSRVSSVKIQHYFSFRFPGLKKALEDLMN